MKTIFTFKLALLFVFLSSFGLAQNNPSQKYIEVTGSAEMTLQPDEIVLEIILTEYKDSQKKIKLNEVENDFYEILRKNKIDTEKLNLESTNNEWYWHWYWYGQYDRYVTRTINLKLDSKTNYLKLSEDLKFKGIQSIRIIKTTNSDIQRLRKEVKKEAIRAAKEKASYLLESVDEKIGGLLTVEELPEASPQNQNYYWFYNRSALSQNATSNSVMSNDSGASEDNTVKNAGEIKLRFEVKAKFEIL